MSNFEERALKKPFKSFKIAPSSVWREMGNRSLHAKLYKTVPFFFFNICSFDECLKFLNGRYCVIFAGTTLNTASTSKPARK